MVSQIQGTPAFQSMGQVSPVSNEMVKIAQMALREIPTVPQTSSEVITSKLKTSPNELKMVSNAKLSEVGNRIPPNPLGITGGFVSAAATVQREMTKAVAGEDQVVFDDSHTMYRGEQDKISDVSSKALPNIAKE